MSLFWTTTGDDWIARRNAYLKEQGLGGQPSQLSGIDFNQNPYAYDAYRDADEAHRQQQEQLFGQWLGTLTPQEQADYQSAMQGRKGEFDKSFKIGKGLALGIIGASGIGAGLTGAGLLGGGGGVSAAEIAGAAGMPELGLAPQTGLGAAGAGAAGSGGLLGGLGSLGGAAELLGKIPTNAWVSGLGGLLAGATTDKNKGNSPPVDNRPGVGLSFGTMQATPGTAQPQAMPQMMPSRYQNSGLGRFGPGLMNPSPYSPTIYSWGKV